MNPLRVWRYLELRDFLYLEDTRTVWKRASQPDHYWLVMAVPDASRMDAVTAMLRGLCIDYHDVRWQSQGGEYHPTYQAGDDLSIVIHLPEAIVTWAEAIAANYAMSIWRLNRLLYAYGMSAAHVVGMIFVATGVYRIVFNVRDGSVDRLETQIMLAGVPASDTVYEAGEGFEPDQYYATLDLNTIIANYWRAYE